MSNELVQNKRACVELISAHQQSIPILPVRPYTASSASPDWEINPNAYEFSEVDQKTDNNEIGPAPIKLVKVGKLLSEFPGVNLNSQDMDTAFATSCIDVISEVIKKLELKGNLKDADVTRFVEHPSYHAARIEYILVISNLVSESLSKKEWNLKKISFLVNHLKSLIPELEINETHETIMAKYTHLLSPLPKVKFLNS